MEQTREAPAGSAARELDHQVAFVTGGATGIGQAVAEALSARGAAVALFARNQPRAQQVAEALRVKGGEAASFETDVSRSASVETAFEAALARYGRVDILVNNAGVAHDGVFARMSLAHRSNDGM